MKEHFCPVEQSVITYQGKCNWCGEREALAQTQEPKIGCVNHDCEKCKAQTQEPVAVVSGYYGGQCVILPIDPAQIFNSNTALYTTPPQRTWVGLTKKEILLVNEKQDESIIAAPDDELIQFARAIEAKLKQKNGYAEEKNNGV